MDDLLYVGRSTNRKVRNIGIKTIGDLAMTDPEILQRMLGKMGLVLHSFANGYDQTPVCPEGYSAPIKSIGNSTTAPRDLTCYQDIQIIFMALAESVAARLRENGFQCRTVEISVRDNELGWYSKQHKLDNPTNITNEIMEAACALFRQSYRWDKPVRSLGIRGTDLVLDDMPYQLNLFMDPMMREKQEKVDRAVDEIRKRFGYFSIQRAFVYKDKKLAHMDAKNEHTVHPHAFLRS